MPIAKSLRFYRCRFLALVSLASVASCSHAQPAASAPVQPVAQVPAQPPPAAPPIAELPMGPSTAPSTTGILVEIEGLGPTLGAIGKALGPLGVSVPGSDQIVGMLAQQLGFKSGSSIDTRKRAGLIVDGAGGFMGGIPKMAFWFGSTSDAALQQDLARSATGKGMAIPEGTPIQVAEQIPGGIAYSTDADYLNQVRGFIAAELAKSPGQPAIELTLDADHLVEHLGPILAMQASNMSSVQQAQMTKAIDWMKTVDTAVVTYRPQPDVFKLLADLTPVAGSPFATLLGSGAPVAAPDGRAVPVDFPVQATFGLSADTIDALQDVAGSMHLLDPSAMEIQKQLASLTSGAFQLGADVSRTSGGFEMVAAIAYTDSQKAKSLSEDLANKMKVFSGLFGSANGLGDKSITSKLMKNATKVAGVPADRIDLALPDHRIVEYLACPVGTCVVAMAANDARAKGDLGTALAGLSGKAGTPMSERPGVKETIALLPDVSHGFVYVDIAAMASRMADDAAGAASSGNPGLGIGWSSDAQALHLVAAVPTSALMAVKTAALMPSSGPARGPEAQKEHKGGRAIPPAPRRPPKH